MAVQKGGRQTDCKGADLCHTTPDPRGAGWNWWVYEAVCLKIVKNYLNVCAVNKMEWEDASPTSSGFCICIII